MTLIGYTFTQHDGGTCRVTGASPIAGYVEVTITYPDGKAVETIRVASQIEARRSGEETRT